MTAPNALIGTTSPAPFQAEMLRHALESWAYFEGEPYPQYAFGPTQWPADKGPIPTPLPYAEILIRESAEFLFRGGAPSFSVPPEQGAGLEKADEFLQAVIRENMLGERWASLAETNGNQGAIAAKFSYDGDRPTRKLRISFLSVPQQCRIWFDPLDCDRPILARIQFPYRDVSDGKWYYFREEWTEELWVKYQPKFAAEASIGSPGGLPGYFNSLGDDGDWTVESQEANHFGLIPVTVIRNRREQGNPLGVGDCWGAFRLMDRIAVSLHGEDKSNQLHSDPTKIILNGEVEGDGQVVSGDTLLIKNQKKDGPPADVKLLEPSGAAREYTHKSIDKWEDLLYNRAGISRIRPEEVSNKGNLSLQAFMMLYQRTIATSDKKRELWGNSGMVPFFRNMLIGLHRLGGVPELAGVDEAVQVSCEWQPYFQITDEDRGNITDRTLKQISGGVLTTARGAERIARAEGIPQSEIKDLQAELEQEAQKRQQEALKAGAEQPGTGNGEDAPPAA